MNKNVELKDEITFDEYKAWLVGMLRGKGSKLPDLNDWKAIKKMTDKVVPDVIETTPYIQPTYIKPAPILEPSPNWWENQPTCGTGDIASADNITISGTSGSFVCGDTTITSEPFSIGSLSSGSGSSYGCYGGSNAYAPPQSENNDVDDANDILNKIRERSEAAKSHKYDTSMYTVMLSKNKDGK